MTPMIHINLIPLQKIRLAGRRRLRCVARAAAISLTVITLAVLTTREWTTESELRAQLGALGRTITAHKSDAATTQHLQQQLDTHRRTLAMLQGIATQPETTHEDVLRSVATAIPRPLWLTRLALTNGTLSLEGRATDHTVIAQFLDELEARPQFANTELEEVHQPKEQPEPGNKRFSVQSRIINHTTELNRNESTP